jgi:hypothetical protein
VPSLFGAAAGVPDDLDLASIASLGLDGLEALEGLEALGLDLGSGGAGEAGA